MSAADRPGLGKFVSFFKLMDACEAPGCPVCRCLLADSRRYLDALLYEQVNDPDVRRRIRAAWGMCNWHTWMLREVADSAFGSAIIYEDALRVVSERVERRGRAQEPTGWRGWRWLSRLLGRSGPPLLVAVYGRRLQCPACVEAAAAEERYLATALRFAEDLQFDRAYARSEGLCVPHALGALQLGGGRGADPLIARTLPKWAALCKSLTGFIEKHNYRNTLPIDESEATATLRAFEALVGAVGLFGSDAHGRYRARRRTRPPTVRAADEPPAAGEDAALERGRLDLRITELTALLGEASTRAAALHYRLAQVAEDRNRLEVNVSGERAANELSQRVIEELRAEVERLRAELDRARSGPAG